MIITVMLTACSGTTPPAKPDVSAETLASEIMTAVPLKSPAEKGLSDLPNYIDGLDSGKIAEIAYYICGSGAYPDELLVLKFRDAADAAAALPKVEARLSSQKDTYTDYTPEEAYKFDDAYIKASGKLLVLAVTENNAAVAAVAGKYM